jgi:broad specificity phosphatase PhoE
VTLGALAGASLTFRILYSHNDDDDDDDDNNNCRGNNTDESSSSCRCSCAIMKRNRLPELVILVRHGESEGNVDNKVWWKKADHEIELTKKGQKQAADAGKRINDILNSYNNNNNNKRIIRNIHLHVSPFERTIQTAKYALPYFDNQYNSIKNEQQQQKRIVKEYHLCTQLREQEFGNTQNSHFCNYREEQKKVGRFWYRFPTGESGADVLGRVKSWWEDSLLNTNERYGYEHCDAVIVFSHGLTVRLILCQLFSWSINTFHSVYNAKNCDLYVLQKDLTKRGRSPYILDGINGELPKSSIDVCVTFHYQSRYYIENCTNNKQSSNNNNNKNPENDGSKIEDGNVNNETNAKESNNKEEEDDDDDDEIPIKTIQVVQKVYKLQDYLSMPSPRITRIDIAKKRLIEQYPNDFDTLDDIESIFFVPFCQYKHQK